MTRKQTMIALMVMAKRIADQKGLDIISTEDSENGLWDQKSFTGWQKTLGEYLTEKYGRMEVTHFTAVPMDRYDMRKDFKVTVGYKFSDPKICVGTQWGADGFACVTFGPADKENDLDYQMTESQIFGEGGIKYFRMIMHGWHEARKENGEDWLDWQKKLDAQKDGEEG